jgi:hypothetical protein
LAWAVTVHKSQGLTFEKAILDLSGAFAPGQIYVATIFIPLTLITGIYGMNFTYMPELSLRWSYPAVLIFIVAGGTAMYLYMRQKKWF